MSALLDASAADGNGRIEQLQKGPKALSAAPDSLEHALVFACGFLAPLFTIAVPGINFTLFDATVLGLAALYVQRRIPYIVSAGYFWSALIFVIGVAFASAFGIRPDFAVGQILQWIFILAIAVPTVQVAVGRQGNVATLMSGFLAAGSFFVLHSVFELATGRAEFEGGRYKGFLGGSQPMSFAVSMLLPYLYLQPFVVQGRVSRIFSKFATPAIVFGLGWILLITASRTAFGAAFVAIGILVVIVPLSRRPGGFSPDVKRIALISLFAILAIVAIVTVLSLSSDSLGGLLRQRLVEKTAKSASSERFLVYAEVFARLDFSIILRGVGPESYPFFSEHRVRPHNIFLIMLAEGGIVTFAGFLSLIGLVAIRALRFLSVLRAKHGPIEMAAAASVVAFAVFIMIASLNTQSIHRIYWVSYAVALGLLVPPRRKLTTHVMSATSRTGS